MGGGGGEQWVPQLEFLGSRTARLDLITFCAMDDGSVYLMTGAAVLAASTAGYLFLRRKWRSEEADAGEPGGTPWYLQSEEEKEKEKERKATSPAAAAAAATSSSVSAGKKKEEAE